MHCSFSLYIRGGSIGQTTTGRIAIGQNYLGQKRLTGQSGLADLDFVTSAYASSKNTKIVKTVIIFGQTFLSLQHLKRKSHFFSWLS